MQTVLARMHGQTYGCMKPADNGLLCIPCLEAVSMHTVKRKHTCKTPQCFRVRPHQQM